jgi:transketolase C-terminal domain/subunit
MKKTEMAFLGEPGALFREPMELRDAAVISYIEMINQGANIMYLVSDSVSTSKIKPFRDLFPER